MNHKTLIYVMRKFDFAAVSQVSELLIHFTENNVFGEIHLLISSLGNPKKFSKEFDRLQQSRIHIHTYKDAPFLHRKLIFRQRRSIHRILEKVVDKTNIDNHVIHTRNILVAHFINAACKRDEKLQAIPLLADFRGTEWAEYLLFTHNKIPLIHEIIDGIETRELLLIEQDIYKSSQAVSAVTTDFMKYLAMMWGARDNVYVTPCLANSELFQFKENIRQQARDEWKLSADDIVILFSTGGASPWQNINPIIESFKQLRTNCAGIADSLKLFILTPAADQFTDKDDAVKIVSSTPHDMYKWLNAADMSILLRDSNIVNHVASPIKVSEYLCAGMPMLTNSGVPMAVKWIEENDFGAVINDLAELTEETLARLKNIDRNKIAARAKDIYSLQVVAQQYETIYKTLSTQRKTH